MKRAIFSVLAVVVFAGLTGCITQHGPRPTACMGGSCAQAPENCHECCNDPNGTGTDPNGEGTDPCKQPGPLARFLGLGHCCGHACPLRRGEGEEAAPAEAGPATGQITYPYYTNRGPRDFLAKNPPSIGP